MIDLCLIVKWSGIWMVVWKPDWKSLFLVQNVQYLNGRPGHMTLPFEYQTLILSSIQIVTVFKSPLNILNVNVIASSIANQNLETFSACQWGSCNPREPDCRGCASGKWTFRRKWYFFRMRLKRYLRSSRFYSRSFRRRRRYGKNITTYLKIYSNPVIPVS